MTHYMPGHTQVPVCGIGEVTVLPDHPVVIRDFRPGLDCRSIEDLLNAAGSPVISGSRDGDVCEYFQLSSAEVALQFRAGTLGFNAVDKPHIQRIESVRRTWEKNR
jgi:hypothetical protein